MIVVCEPICWESEHVPFNTAMLEIIRIAFPSEKIIFYAEQSHLKQVIKQIKFDIQSTIIWKEISIPPRHSKYSHRWKSDWKLANYLFKILNQDTFGHLLLTSITPPLLTAIKFLLSFIYKNKSVQIIFHGNLSTLSGWRSRNPFIRIQDLKTALTLPSHKNIQYIVLEQPIRKELIYKLPSIAERVVVLNHPIPSSEGGENTVDFCPPFRFGFLGLVTEGKGGGIFVKFASEISNKFPGHVEFHVIGRLENKNEVLEISALTTKPGYQRLSREEYIRRLKALHFVCFPYFSNHYKLSPSGTLLDAIAWEKPFIASKLPIFRNLIYRFGDIGYLCSNEAEFRDCLEKIVKEADLNRYKKQVLSIRQVRYSRTPNSLATTYRDICKKLRI